SGGRKTQSSRNVEQRALAGAVVADNRQAVAVLHRKADISESVERLFWGRPKQPRNPVAQQHLTGMPGESFGDVFERDYRHLKYARKTSSCPSGKRLSRGPAW